MRRAVVGGLVLAVVVAFGVALWPTDDDLPVPPATSAPPSTIAPLSPGPATYHVTYRVEDHAGDEVLVSTDDLWVRRPWDSRLESRTGAPPGTETRTTTISSFGVFSSVSANSPPLVIAVSPGPGAGDLRLDATLADLVRVGAVEVGGRDTVLGRPCRIYRTGEPIGTGSLVAPTDESHAEACIDDRGILLREEWTEGGRLFRRKVAVSFEEPPATPPDLFAAPGLPIAQDVGGGSVTKQAPDARPLATYWELPEPPDGFTNLGRYIVRKGNPGAAQGQPTTEAPETYVDVYVDGGDYVLIEQGSRSSNDQRVAADPVARAVDAGDLPVAELVVGAYNNVIRGRPDAVIVVRVMGTISAARLTEIARDLVPIEPPGR